MKIAVYTICLNEEKHIERWAKSAEDADYRIIVDTGSTDNTLEVARKAGCTVHSVKLNPWRFDDARNVALALVPTDADFCIALDADEILVKGWREHLEKVSPQTTRPRYKYTWSWKDDGTPDLIYYGDKIHRRFGYRWKHPAHEVITPTGEEVAELCGLEIHHHPDPGKPRSYSALLELAAQEQPNCDRTAHYLAREYLFLGEIDKAVKEFKRHLNLPTATWPAERARSFRYLAQAQPELAEKWLLMAAAEDPTRRDVWADLTKYYYSKEDWVSCYTSGLRALAITERGFDYMSEAWPWGSLVPDLVSVACWNLGLHEMAYEYGKQALDKEPNNERIATNLKYYQEAINKLREV